SLWLQSSPPMARWICSRTSFRRCGSAGKRSSSSCAPALTTAGTSAGETAAPSLLELDQHERDVVVGLVAGVAPGLDHRRQAGIAGHFRVRVDHRLEAGNPELAAVRRLALTHAIGVEV